MLVHVICDDVNSSVEVEPGDPGQYNEDISDDNSVSVGKQESNTAATTRHRGHATTLRQQEGLYFTLMSTFIF